MPRVPFRPGTTPEQQQAIREWQEAEAKRRAEEHQQAVDKAVGDHDIPAIESLWNIEVSRACHSSGPTFDGLRRLEKLTTAAAACCAAVGMVNTRLRQFRVLVKELAGPSSFDRHAFGYNASMSAIRVGATAELGDLRLLHETAGIRLTRVKTEPTPPPPSAATEAPTVHGPRPTLGFGGPGKTFDALCECMRKAHPGAELRAGCRIELKQAKATSEACSKADDHLAPKGRLCAGGWIRRDGKVIELTEQGAIEAARRAEKRAAKQR